MPRASENLNKSDIELAVFGITYMEYCLMIKPKRAEIEDDWLVKAVLVKQKLYRMKDGLEIQKDFDKEEKE